MSVFPQTFPVFLPFFFFSLGQICGFLLDDFFFMISGCLAVWTQYCSLLHIFRHYCKSHVSQLHSTVTINNFPKIKIKIILKLLLAEDLKWSTNAGPWNTAPQKGYQEERYMAITSMSEWHILLGDVSCCSYEIWIKRELYCHASPPWIWCHQVLKTWVKRLYCLNLCDCLWTKTHCPILQQRALPSFAPSS